MVNYPKENLYKVLGVQKSSTESVIKAAWRKKLSEFHPDQPSSLERCKKKFPRKQGETSAQYERRMVTQLKHIAQVINIAKEVLLDKQKRKEYDAYLSNATSRPGAGSSSSNNKTYADGRTYTGSMDAHGEPHGKGHMIFPDGMEYTGEFVNGVIHGTGRIVFPNGEKYEGDFAKETMTGRGRYTWPNGDIYEGEFLDGDHHGQGTMRWANGETYKGAWENDQPHGHGTKTYANGSTENGNWQNGYFQNTQQSTYSGAYASSNNHSSAGAQSTGGGSGGGHAAGYGSAGRSYSSPSNDGYSLRPFILKDPKGFLTRKYGVKGGMVYENEDFLGMFTRASRQLPLGQMGQATHQDGFFCGTAKFPGLYGAPGVEWKNVVFPQSHAKRVQKISQGQSVSKGRVSANLIAIFTSVALSIGLNSNMTDDSERAVEKFTTPQWAESFKRKNKTTPPLAGSFNRIFKEVPMKIPVYVNSSDAPYREFKGVYFGSTHNSNGLPFGGGMFTANDRDPFSESLQNEALSFRWVDGEPFASTVRLNKIFTIHSRGILSGKSKSSQFDHMPGFIAGGCYIPHHLQASYMSDVVHVYADRVFWGKSPEACGYKKRHRQIIEREYPDGEYRGEYKNGVRSGFGHFTLQDKDGQDIGEYTGFWKDGKKHGYGVYTQDEDNKNVYQYIGEWKNGKPHGKGGAGYANGSEYLGYWLDGKRHGRGIYKGETSDYDDYEYSGLWSNGKPHGYGVYVYNDEEHKGVWANGCLNSNRQKGTSFPTPKLTCFE